MERKDVRNNEQCLDTVRVLHQTVVSLRKALEESRSEILELKSKAWPLDDVENVLRNLSLENHILRQQIIGFESKKFVDEDEKFKHLEDEDERNEKKRKRVRLKSPIKEKDRSPDSKSLEFKTGEISFKEDPRSNQKENTRKSPSREDTKKSSPREDTRKSSSREDIKKSSPSGDTRKTSPREVTTKISSREDIRKSPLREEIRKSPLREDTKKSPSKGETRKHLSKQTVKRDQKRETKSHRSQKYYPHIEPAEEAKFTSEHLIQQQVPETRRSRSKEISIKKVPEQEGVENAKRVKTKPSDVSKGNNYLTKERERTFVKEEKVNLREKEIDTERERRLLIDKTEHIGDKNENLKKGIAGYLKRESLKSKKELLRDEKVKKESLKGKKENQILLLNKNSSDTEQKNEKDICELKKEKTEKKSKESEEFDKHRVIDVKIDVQILKTKRERKISVVIPSEEISNKSLVKIEKVANKTAGEKDLNKRGEKNSDKLDGEIFGKSKEEISKESAEESSREENLGDSDKEILGEVLDTAYETDREVTNESYEDISDKSDEILDVGDSNKSDEKVLNKSNREVLDKSVEESSSVSDKEISNNLNEELVEKSGVVEQSEVEKSEEEISHTSDEEALSNLEKSKAKPLYSTNDLTSSQSTKDNDSSTSQQFLAPPNSKGLKHPSESHNVNILEEECAKILITTVNLSPRKNSKSLESVLLKPPLKKRAPIKNLSFSKTISYSNLSDLNDSKFVYYFEKIAMSEETKANFEKSNERSRISTRTSQELDAEQEVDEVELIFTTDETKDEDFKEELVSIETNTEPNQLLGCPISDFEQNLSHESNLSAELEDDVFNNDNFENENQENCNFQNRTFENSNMLNSKSDNSINNDERSLRSYYSYQDSSFENRSFENRSFENRSFENRSFENKSFENKSMEKDESFDKFEERIRIVETDISKCGIQDFEYSLGRRNTCPNPLQYRPLVHREAIGKGGRKSRPILGQSNATKKESGAQTDISALPGSSWRSESNLIHKVKIGENFTTLPSKFPMPGSRLKLCEKTVEARRILLSDLGFTSMVPELSRSADHLCPANFRPPTTTSNTTFGQFLRTPDLYSPSFASQRFMWNTTATPSEGSHTQSRYSSLYPLTSPPAPARRCSAPVSPSRRTMLKPTSSKVRFANGSLPELRGDWNVTVDSGDSTDSLVEEAEHYLRRSIDCVATGCGVSYKCPNEKSLKGGIRRASAPEPSRDNVPPPGWQPFLPRVPRDLRSDHWVKVISSDGRVKGGRVRYVGPLQSQSEQFVGVQLSTPDGYSDGSYNNRRYFQCEPYHGIFVPFKKVVMGWRP